MNFDNSYEIKVANTYIIVISGNEESERLAQISAEACKNLGQSYELFHAVDGTSGNIRFPYYHAALELLKFTNMTLSSEELGCMLSHYLLWVRCIELDAPIVILEHDGVLIKRYEYHPFYNVIEYLGCSEQVRNEHISYPIPPYCQMNSNSRYIFKTHAYSIDPFVARQMVAKLIQHGVYTSADVFMKVNDFAIIQTNLYATDIPGNTTIPKNNLTEEQQREELDAKSRYN